MIVAVLLFARYREAAGAASIEIEIGAGATLADVWERVRARVPALRDEGRPLFSCDRAYARPDRPVSGSEEIAVFPPVSGG
ncbi:MAG TPA: MoaD/ThiS family protein [Candidatus Polarisedimenticolia bacterium]|jgi:molybdopterin converting factor small subunit|nr:MoaD/ThiS family protein [Candidatus Polarisedimenticolia bacterium]